MVAFARFVMRDNGLAIHINAQQVTQVRQTTEGEPAIYTLGRDTPMVVEGTLEAVIRKLEAAAAGIRIVEPALDVASEPPMPAASPPALELVSVEPAPKVKSPPDAAAAPDSEVAAARKSAKSKALVQVKPAEAKAPVKVAPAKSKSAKKKTAKTAKADVAREPPEPPYPSASWFMGNR